jgi:hypothetical protein
MATMHRVITTDEQIDRAMARAASLPKEPRAISIEYRPGLTSSSLG